MPIAPYPPPHLAPIGSTPPVDQQTKDAAAVLSGALGPGFKPRAATPIRSTDSLPTATMITVPSVKSSGEMPAISTSGETAPVVGANTVNKWTDPQFVLGVLTCAAGVVTAIYDVLPSSGPIDWRALTPKLILAVIGAVGSFLRQRTNTLTK